MKKILGCLLIFGSVIFVYSQSSSEGSSNAPSIEGASGVVEAENSTDYKDFGAESTDEGDEKSEKKVVKSRAGVSDVPDQKRPQKQDKDKIDKLDEQFPDDRKTNADTLKYGMEDDIVELMDKLLKNEDVRFVDEVYDLFEVTKNVTVRDKILEYFTKLEDPCLEDYAVMILNDPYDEKKSTVSAVFKYVQAVKTKEAVPAVLTLLENEEEDYFNNALTTIGDIGGPEEAVYLTEYLDREDLTVAQKQQLVKVLGKIKAVQTYDKLVELAEDTDENTFIRMYSAEAIGSMEKKEAIPVLLKLYEDSDPKLRCYVIKGLSHFPEDDEAKSTILEAIRDAHVTVRLEAVDVCKKNDYKEAVPFLIYRLEKEKEDSVKKKCYPAIASLNTKEGNEYLVKQITDKKVADTPKSRIAQALLEQNNTGTEEIIELARETLKDDRRKPLRYALGKEFAKYQRNEFAQICKEYIASKDTATQGTGLDIYAKGRYGSVTEDVRSLVISGAKQTKKNANAEKAEKILGSSDASVIEAQKIKDERAEAELNKTKPSRDNKKEKSPDKKTAASSNESSSEAK